MHIEADKTGSWLQDGYGRSDRLMLRMDNSYPVFREPDVRPEKYKSNDWDRF